LRPRSSLIPKSSMPCSICSKDTTTHYPSSALTRTRHHHAPHHPFEGQSLEVLRHARMPGGLQFVLILPDGSKSLVPAEWTDFRNPTDSPQPSQLVGSLADLLRLRDLTDALLRRAPGLPVTSGASQQDHAATESEPHRHSRPGDVPMGAVRRRTKATRRRSPGAPLDQS